MSVEGALRHQSRERTLSILYEAELKGVDPDAVVAEMALAPDEFCLHLLELISTHRTRADELVAESSVGWPPDRMAVLDRLVLRLAVCELLEVGGEPVPVILDEAVELAKTFSTQASGGFVNGVLSTVASKVR